MSCNLHWRRAVILSVICHIFFIIGAGYLSAHIPATPISEEKYVELELMNTPQAENVKDNVSSNAPMPASQLSQSTPGSAINQQISSLSTSESTNVMSVVTTEALTITSVSGNGTTPSATEGSGSSSGSKTTAIKSNGSGVIAPSILNKMDPTYPPSARLAGIEGTVILKIQIHENGRGGAITIFRSSGNDELDNAAIAAVKQWRFIPAKDRDSGQPITCYTTMPIAFHLK